MLLHSTKYLVDSHETTQVREHGIRKGKFDWSSALLAILNTRWFDVLSAREIMD